MAGERRGRIRAADIVTVRERAKIDEIVGEHLQLKRAGGGSLKGLCPFHDEKSPSFQVTPSRNLFHCLAGETGVLTEDGVVPIRELSGRTVRVLDGTAHWVEAPVRSYGVQRLMKVQLTRNGRVKDLYATDEHRWFVRADKTRGRLERLTKDLRPGDRLVTSFPRSRLFHAATVPSPVGVARGLVAGDGTRSDAGSIAVLFGDEDAELTRFSQGCRSRTEERGMRFYGMPAHYEDERPALEDDTSYRFGWLAGYVAADGCVAEDGDAILDPACLDDLEYVRALCTRLGIGTSGIARQTRMGIHGVPSDVYDLRLTTRGLPESFHLPQQHRERATRRTKAYERTHWVVRSVEWSDRVEEVFCAEVPGTHAFTLEDDILTGNCFGCGVGGDVISFVQQIDHLSFTEAVELLAGRTGVQLQYEDDGGRPTGAPDRAAAGQRARLVAANTAAAAFYAEQLMTADAAPAQQFLADRGFTREMSLDFGCGFAPGGWDGLTRHLRQLGFSQGELETAGLSKQSSRGTYIDRFHRRLLWPIRDITGDVIGFGARKLMDDDPGPKYLNTPETPLYKKSSVLYGIERAKREIARKHQAVVVEGYTDVMACHVAGVTTAVASCGTAFGTEHIGVLRRLLMDQDSFRGEVIYTFDGDAAGQAAAMKTFSEDQRFVAQTFVAVEQEGRDPCELRQAHGDAAVRDLIARRSPLVEFVLRTTLADYDLDTVEGRVAALEKTAPMVAAIKDHALRPAYAARLAGMIGNTDEAEVRERVRVLSGDTGQGQRPRPRPRAAQRTPDDAAREVEREAVKAALQSPELAGPSFDAVDPGAYTDPDYAAVAAAVAATGGAAAATVRGADWLELVTTQCTRDTARAMLTALAVEPMRSVGENDAGYVNALMARLQLMAVERDLATLKGKLQRMNPVEQADEYMALFGRLMALEQLARSLRERAAGGLGA
ncbi:DNA primase [Modestobacter sp. I12A-02628]|uniref:DNA primase n=1 Tax=Goekera deserti TaxID=2497753 RepID=A0A7K3WAY7_9ACTN|nr:DNA primase [Goekera deserti]MPQ97523.1 DNA primase [Goekera deserti]NDI47873.1 DNA primase [Goekera deserti]NEL53621.1 DNA primase [Goekera deserti]